MGSSSSAIRSRQLIQGLLDLGHTVRSIHAGQVAGYPFSCPIHRKPFASGPCRCPVGRLYRYLFYRLLRLIARMRPAGIDRALFASVRCALASDATYDVVITASDPASSHQLVSRCRREGTLQDCLWVQHWGDPLANDISRSWLLPQRAVQGIERRLLASADRVVYVSPFTLEQQQRLYPVTASRMSWLPVPAIGPMPNPAPLEIDGPVQIGYFGDYRRINRDVTPLLEAVVQADDCFLHIAGEGDVQIPVCERIVCHPRLPMSRLEPLFASCHVIVCVLNRTGAQIPGKVYHWAESRHHILVTYDTAQAPVARHLERYERFVFCPNTAEDIMITLKDIRAGRYNHLARPCDMLSSKTIARQLLEIAASP